MVAIGLQQAATLLEVVLDQLQAQRLTAAFTTKHGTVEIVVPGPRILVNGQEVPRRVEVG